MNARQLLEAIRARGGVASVKLDGDLPRIQITPRGLVSDLATDIQRFKPALLELLTAPESSRTPATPSPFRTVSPSLLVPAKVEAAPGAAVICKALQSHEWVFALARGGDLPPDALDVSVEGESHALENVADVVAEIEATWTATARRCQRERRDLTPGEAGELEAAAVVLETVLACYGGPDQVRS